MTKVVKGFPLLVLALSIAAVGYSAQYGAQKGSKRSTQERTIQGELTKVDSTDQMFTVRTSDEQEVQFHYESTTKVEGSQGGVQGLASETGTRVTVHYKEESGKKTATRIVILKGDK